MTIRSDFMTLNPKSNILQIKEEYDAHDEDDGHLWFGLSGNLKITSPTNSCCACFILPTTKIIFLSKSYGMDSGDFSEIPWICATFWSWEKFQVNVNNS
jgi:hypothetical protein